jgi:hypothetical protein
MLILPSFVSEVFIERYVAAAYTFTIDYAPPERRAVPFAQRCRG